MIVYRNVTGVGSVMSGRMGVKRTELPSTTVVPPPSAGYADREQTDGVVIGVDVVGGHGDLHGVADHDPLGVGIGDRRAIRRRVVDSEDQNLADRVVRRISVVDRVMHDRALAGGGAQGDVQLLALRFLPRHRQAS